jgi:hypothetical protein
MGLTDDQFNQVGNEWDLQTLYGDLTFAKGKPLTPVEKLHLRGLLSGFSPSEIAEKLQKNPKGVETDLCATVYKYVKNLLDKANDRIENWRNIASWLEEAGYKAKNNTQIPVNQLLPENSVVNITNVSIERNQVVILINLRIPTSEVVTENLGN